MLLGVLTGTTASGKSALALEFASARGCEIVGADSRQIYRGFRIGTGQPTAADLARAVHRLVDCVPPEENFSAGAFASAVLELERGSPDVPRLVVGGTGFYVSALVRGLPPIPPVDAGVRAAVLSDLEERGVEALHAELSEADPEAAARLPLSDARRIARALEVWRATGRPFSSWKDEGEAPFPDLPVVVLEPPPAENRALIAKRVRGMFRSGWREEVEGLLRSGVPESAPAFGSLGYPQVLALLKGEISEAEAIETTVVKSAQYAKRQRTYFRGQFPDAVRLEPGSAAPADLARAFGL